MTKEQQIQQAYKSMAYGDAIGFLYENTGSYQDFMEFSFEWSQDIILKQAPGQYSDLTELLIILTKSLLDDIDCCKVTVDDKRLLAELELFQYYRHGNPINLLSYINEGNNYHKGPAYRNDKRGYGVSRVAAIFFANKNLKVAIEEIYRHIIATNIHPQVILTALLVVKVLYLLLENSQIEREDLIQQLKEYLINLRRQDFEIDIEFNIHPLQYEKEKVEYIIALDRIKDAGQEAPLKEDWNSRDMLMAAITSFFRLRDEKSLNLEIMPSYDIRESLALAYGFFGICNSNTIELVKNLKNAAFIENMGEYIVKLRNYEIKRKQYTNENMLDIFNQKTGSTIKHPILNVCKIMDRTEDSKIIQVLVNSKSGEYLLTKRKDSD
ncbi:ADP-ribosylglycohydrolase family protein [Alkaliphilus peptidifermentans]|uniref:ADP-ribosylglycohydrolase n=1 Tax=Alkaliphilus peptidifermentans DSM 18978 TaxID=1120976 RepID=A0A1G5K9W4_9FIRM|nr:ADP-ribosylglycohydrolase family protein [Alkaliphilus peptidifermentans]SCY97396.1 ADP-ribosylglycohydrolase [Alkaliphilus peptidifermentans DSM 18978]